MRAHAQCESAQVADGRQRGRDEELHTSCSGSGSTTRYAGDLLINLILIVCSVVIVLSIIS